MTTFKELDEALMGQYTIDSMYSKKPVPGLIADDEIAISIFQMQAADWCHHSKPLFFSEQLRGMPGVSPQQVVFMDYIKTRMSNYMLTPRDSADSWMKWLYSHPDKSVIVTQIAHLTQASLFKNVKNFGDSTEEQKTHSLDQESVAIIIAIYTYFTILVNPSFSPSDYDYLFQHSWYHYYAGWRSFGIMLAMKGDSWSDDLNDVLI